jgi:hypothetical protein
VGSIVVIIVDVLAKQQAKVRLVEHDDVIQELAPTRTDPPFNDAVLPRGAKAYPLGRRSDGGDCVDDRLGEELVAIDDEVLRA